MNSILRTLLIFVLLAAAGFAAASDFAETMKKAEAGDAVAQSKIGYAYYKRGGANDSVEAMKWWRKAAEQGYALAQFNLGAMYGNGGTGVPKDLVQAHVWYNIAGANGHEDAKPWLAIAEKQMTSDQKAEAMKLARELFAKLPKGK